MIGIALIVINLLVLAVLVLFLHWQTQRWGFAPLLLVLGGLTGLLQGHYGIYIRPADGLQLFATANLLVPVVIMAVLIIYICDGSVSARASIYSILIVSFVVLGMEQLLRFYLSLPEGGSTTGLTPDKLVYNLHITFASVIAFTADIFVIAIAYQGARNQATKLPEWVIVGIALVIAMWTDSIVFTLLSSASVMDFVNSLPGDVVGKTLSAIVLWAPTAYYVTRIAPALPDHVGGDNRPTFDLFKGSFRHIRMALARSEAALQESETKRRQDAIYFRQISENVNEALWLTSGDETKVLYVNSRHEQIFGRKNSAFYTSSDTFLECVHPDDRERVRRSLPRQNAPDKTIEYRIVQPDGSIRWVRDRAFPIVGDDGKVMQVAGITDDITERRLLEEQQVALKVAQQKETLLREFIAEATHDLKTPLSSLNLMLFRLSKVTEEEAHQRLTTELTALTGQLGQMIEDILTLSRLDSTGELTLSAFDLNGEIQNQCASLHHAIEQKSLTVAFDLTTDPIRLQADFEDLSRAICNLIENAVRYTPNKGTITLKTQVVGNEVIFSVTDTGIGIPLADQPHIFERFYRANNVRLTAAGTGLGLAIVKKIVEQHHGRIEFTSVENKGTTFRIHLPLAGS